jgi:hypothetical protein
MPLAHSKIVTPGLDPGVYFSNEMDGLQTMKARFALSSGHDS